MKTFSQIITFADRPTGTGQIYPAKLLDEAFNIYMAKDKLFRYGGMEPPTNDPVVDKDRISHYLINVWRDADAVWGEIEIAEDKPMGKILSTLVDAIPDRLTLGLAAMATFEGAEVISRNLFKAYHDEPTKKVDNMAVATVYVLDKGNTNH
jgi:hypothetical protein